MAVSLHPSAIIAFNEKAEKLLRLVQPTPRPEATRETFPSDVPAAASITEHDIIGDLEESVTDYQGNTVARYFYVNDIRYGLEQESYSLLKDLASAVCSSRSIRDKLSAQYVEKALFDWIRSAFAGQTTTTTFCDALILAAEKDVVQFTSWIPVANLEIETAFPLGYAELRPVSPSVIDAWAKRTSSVPEEHREGASQLFSKIRSRFQGRAAVVTSVEAEPKRAFEAAVELAETATSLLGIFSVGTLLPDVKCISRISGSEVISKATVISNPDGDAFHMTESILDLASAQAWRLGYREIIEMRKSGLDAISGLLLDNEPNDFKRAILNALLIYSKSAFTAEPIEKVIYILSSLESMLLKNESEPIQQNLAERMAIFTAKELAKRKEIIANIKAIYSVRSRYLHHGHIRSELNTIQEFLMAAWVFYVQLLGSTYPFSTRLEFVAAIDDAKLS